MPSDHSRNSQARPQMRRDTDRQLRLVDIMEAVAGIIVRNGLEQQAIAEIAARTGLPLQDERRWQRRAEDRRPPEPEPRDERPGRDEPKQEKEKGQAADNKPDKDRPDPSDGNDGGKDDDGKEGDDKDGEDKKPPMPPEKKRRLIIIGVIVGIVLLIVLIAVWLYERQFVNTDDAQIDGYISQVAPQAAGRIAQLLITDNEQVQAGQVIAEIDPRDYQQRLDEAQAQLGQMRAQVDVEAAAAYQADRDLRRYRAVDPQAVTAQARDNAFATARSARARLIADTAAVKNAAAAVANAKLQLSYCHITAPVAGRIARRTVDVGNVVSVGQPLLAIVPRDVWVTANFKETQLDHMRPGQVVRIDVDAFPGVAFKGRVDSFQKGTGTVFSTLPPENATGNFVKIVQRVPVKITFDDPQQRDQYPLAPGMSVEPRVTVR